MKKSIYTNYDELPLLLSVKQLVDLMGVSDSTIYELIQEGVEFRPANVTTEGGDQIGA